jgi:hypothetical protein
MNVASLELCKELYELSGWNTDLAFWSNETPDGWEVVFELHAGDEFFPAYDLGYLLRKLPHEIEVDGVPGYYLRIEAPCRGGNQWMFNYSHMKPIETWNESPEDAACKLAIELFKQGVLSSSDGRRADQS